MYMSDGFLEKLGRADSRLKTAWDLLNKNQSGSQLACVGLMRGSIDDLIEKLNSKLPKDSHIEEAKILSDIGNLRALDKNIEKTKPTQTSNPILMKNIKSIVEINENLLHVPVEVEKPKKVAKDKKDANTHLSHHGKQVPNEPNSSHAEKVKHPNAIHNLGGRG